MIQKIKIVYFAYLLPNKWHDVIIEQLDSLKKLDLYNIASNIYMSVVSDDVELNKLKILLSEKYNKIELVNIFKENVYEYPGIKTLYEISEEDTLILYFHSKGVTSNLHRYRQCLFKYTVENYVEIIKEFNENEKLNIAGIIPHVTGFVYYNFFWVKNDYVRKYCIAPNVEKNRYNWEVWLGNNKIMPITYSPIIKYDQVGNQFPVFTNNCKTAENIINKLINEIN